MLKIYHLFEMLESLLSEASYRGGDLVRKPKVFGPEAWLVHVVTRLLTSIGLVI